MFEKKVGVGRGSGGEVARGTETVGKRTLVEQMVAAAPVQRTADASGTSDAEVHAAAAHGVATQAVTMPHYSMIQRVFGRHDLSSVQAHVGGAAETANRAMGASAYATGNHVAFASAPDLHTAAHEAAHVVQQRAGVGLTGGVGQTGDAYERHADAVADAVVRGQSAEDLLSRHGASHLPAVSQPAIVQRKAPTHAVTAADLDTRGEEQHAADLTDKQIHDAMAWNDKHWTGDQRRELRIFLTHAPDHEGGFTEADVRAVRKIQTGAGVEPAKADGVIGDTTMAILLQSGLTLGFDGKRVKAEAVQLLFIPGEFEDVAKWQAAATEAIKRNPTEPYRALVMPSGTGRIYVKVNGNIVDVANARGGPAVTVKDAGGHTADPTTAGTWTLGAGKPVVTSSWDNSQIPWGAEVRKCSDGEWEFKDPDANKWKIATGPKSVLAKPLNASVFESDDDNKGRRTWRINDFGEMGWRIQGTDGQFIHTTPGDEESTLDGIPPELRASHGCVHLDPGDRTRLRDRGYLQAGVTFVVRTYTVHLLPAAMRQIMQGGKPLHDKPTHASH